MSRQSLGALTSLLVALAAAPGCGRATFSGDAPTAAIRHDDVVVASIDGVPVTASRLASHARALGVDLRGALHDLIAFELLAQEGARRGYAALPEIQEAKAREMVRRFLQAEFESRARPEDIPESDIRREYERNKGYFQRPELRSVVTALFPAKRGVASTADHAKARAAAKELADRWRAEQPKDAEAAKAIVDTYFGHLGGVRVDRFNTYEGAEAEKEWHRAALAMRRPGEVSAPVQTRFGWHVIWLEGIHPARSTPEAEALATIRREMHPVWQRAQFARFVEEIASRHRIESYPERLAAAGAPSPPAPSR